MIQGNQAAARFKPGGWGRPEVLENGGGKLFSHVLRYTELRQAREAGLTRGSQGLGNPRRFRNCYFWLSSGVDWSPAALTHVLCKLNRTAPMLVWLRCKAGVTSSGARVWICDGK